MAHELIQNNYPVAGEEDMLLYGLGTGPNGKQSLQSFTQHIVWLRSSTTQIHMVYGGKVVKECGTYVDGNHYLGSVAFAVSAALDLVDHFGIAIDSPLLIETRTTVIDTPVMRVDHETPMAAQIREWNHFESTPNRYYLVPRNWGMGEIQAAQDQRIYLQEKHMIDDLVSWSSSLTPLQVLAKFEECQFLRASAFGARSELGVQMSLQPALASLSQVLGLDQHLPKEQHERNAPR